MQVHILYVHEAEKYGAVPALILAGLRGAIRSNASKRRNWKEGRYWTFDSIKSLCERYPYLTENKMEYALRKLIDAGALVVGEFNKFWGDRTRWYGLPNNDILWQEVENLAPDGDEDSRERKIPDSEDTTPENSDNGRLKIPTSVDGKIQRVPITSNVQLINNPYSPLEGDKSDSSAAPPRVDVREQQAHEAVEYLNERTGHRYRPGSALIRGIKKRLDEVDGDLDGVKVMIDRQVALWGKDANMRNYLRPQTLFRASNFDGYYAQRNDQVARRKLTPSEVESVRDKILQLTDDIQFRAKSKEEVDAMRSEKRRLEQLIQTQQV